MPRSSSIPRNHLGKRSSQRNAVGDTAALMLKLLEFDSITPQISTATSPLMVFSQIKAPKSIMQCRLMI
ncbi:hypothetical protein V2W45_304256 [Cenococcum geophilum]